MVDNKVYSEEKIEKVMVLDYISEFIEKGRNFQEKWSKVAEPIPPKENAPDREIVVFLQNSFRNNSKKREEFEMEVLININKIFEMATIVLGEGHLLIVELRDMIDRTYDYNEENNKSFLDLLKKVVDIIDLN